MNVKNPSILIFTLELGLSVRNVYIILKSCVNPIGETTERYPTSLKIIDIIFALKL